MEKFWFFEMVFAALVGFCLPHVLKLLAWPFIYMRSHLLKGGWWEYHYSALGGTIKIFESNVKIRVGLRGSLVFDLLQILNGIGIRHKGTIQTEKGSSQFVMIGKSMDIENEEFSMWRFHLPLKTKASLITGIHISYNHDKEPFSSIAFLSRDKVEIEDADVILKRIQVDSSDYPMILINKGSPKDRRYSA